MNKFSGWRRFGDVSLQLLQQGYPFVLLADIAAYYENIDIGRLITELGAAGVKSRTLSLLTLLREVPSVARGSAVVGVPVVRSPFAVTDRAPG